MQVETGAPFGPVDYTSDVPPERYVCQQCGAKNCKLWREYQTFLNHQTLYCAPCAGKAQNHDVSGIDEQGKIPSGLPGPHQSDQIGWLVPAVPTVEGDTYWGYTSVPPEGVDWWQKLPSLSKKD